MGVRGLLSYITNDAVLQKIELSQLAAKIRHKTEKSPMLLCDFRNMVPYFLDLPVLIVVIIHGILK